MEKAVLAVLQAYQADLLKDLDKGQGFSPDEVADMCRTTDLALRATKQAATAMGRSMAAMVVTKRHLWVNLADIGKNEKGSLLDAQSHLPSLSVPPSRQWSRSSGRRRRAQQLLKPSFQEGPGLSPKNAGVLACPGLRVGDGHRRLVSQLMHLPHLRVVLEGGTGQKEVGKT